MTMCFTYIHLHNCVILFIGNCGNGDGTCSVLRNIVYNVSSDDCTTNGEKDCDTLSCTGMYDGQPFRYDVTILPCNHSATVNVRLSYSGTIVLDEEFSESGEAKILGLATLEVTLDHLDDHTIGLEVELT